ncbi:hypothetical protein RB195_014777 [Necator americanus]|uniref:Uncharacterized protein n=1 Tax=Necator americanus TaxID=51031 RepID=A0ABR1E226_NECAM
MEVSLGGPKDFQAKLKMARREGCWRDSSDDLFGRSAQYLIHRNVCLATKLLRGKNETKAYHSVRNPRIRTGMTPT